MSTLAHTVRSAHVLCQSSSLSQVSEIYNALGKMCIGVLDLVACERLRVLCIDYYIYRSEYEAKNSNLSLSISGTTLSWYQSHSNKSQES